MNIQIGFLLKSMLPISHYNLASGSTGSHLAQKSKARGRRAIPAPLLSILKVTLSNIRLVDEHQVKLSSWVCVFTAPLWLVFKGRQKENPHVGASYKTKTKNETLKWVCSFLGDPPGFVSKGIPHTRTGTRVAR